VKAFILVRFICGFLYFSMVCRWWCGLSEGEKTVKVSVDVWERLMKMKIEMRARSLDEVIRELFRRADAG